MKLSFRLLFTVSACGVGILLVLVLLVAITQAAPSESALTLPSWAISQVDVTSFLHRGNTSIAVDSSGRIHVSYLNNHELRYAVFSNTTWLIQSVDVGADVSAHSLALDTQGNPHIAYIALYPAATTGYLRYATLDGTNWTTQTVEDNPSIGGSNGCAVSLAVDGNDKPHISYGAMPSLRYAELTSTGWLTQTIDEGVLGYMCSTLDVETSGKPHVAYYDMGTEGGGTLKYAVLTQASWDIQVIDEGGMDFGLPCTLRLDEAHLPHILYYDGDNHQLRYAVYGGTMWRLETVPTPIMVDANFRGAMALDSNARPHISFSGQYGQNLIYMTLNGSKWVFQTVDGSLGAGMANSIALSDADHIAISYLDTYLNQVKVARSLSERIFLPIVMTH